MAIPALSAVAVLGYLVQLIARLFEQVPDWVLDVSLFRLYGTPLTSGVYWTASTPWPASWWPGPEWRAMRTREVGR